MSPSSSKKSNIGSVPSISDNWSLRSDTVRHLYDVLLEEGFVHVRGTPGCGKSTLMTLLQAYILKQEPSAFVNTEKSWLKETEWTGQRLKERFKEVDPDFPRRKGRAFLLFDEGQDSYKDRLLWNSFFKEVRGGIFHRYHAVLFCSYGSPGSRPVSRDISNIALSDAARVSLWPGERSIGMLLNRSEFNEVVSRFERPLNLHPDLLDLIFDWTVGHAGAVIELLRVISYQRVSDMQQGVQFTVEAFHEENPTHDLVERLRGGAFERGLPLDHELASQPDVVALFRTLLRDGAVESDVNEVIQDCHRHGWVHADLTEGGAAVRYVLPSPLHAACLSWRLEPTHDMPHFASIFDLVLEVVSNLKPAQLRFPVRRVGTNSTDSLQYQDEFYRSVFSATLGNVRLSPEFSSARGARVAGCIDFFIPKVNWGIEITQDGNRLTEHSSRFADSGAYGAWPKAGDMADYILLDCRTSIPTKQHPDIPNLFHVVFEDGYQEVVVFNNMAEPVKGPIVLHDR